MSILIRLFKGSLITDQDRVTKLLDSPKIFSQMGLEYSGSKEDKQIILRFAKAIYKFVSLRISTAKTEEIDELNEIIEYNEDEMIKYLKFKVWNYQLLITEETDKFVKEGGRVIKKIMNIET